MYSLRMHVLKQ